jgi:pSer/pThr/pTyr-binding forkhead associated (FHA) protein
MPRSAAPVGTGTPSPVPPAIEVEWVAEVWVDPQWYAAQEAEDPCPSPGLPVVIPLRVSSALIGRVSASRNIHPEIDCQTDSAVSRRHAQLTTDGTRWFVEDLQSSNGTFIGPASGPLPENPIAAGPKTELQDGDRLYVGAWTRIVIRRATDEERLS